MAYLSFRNWPKSLSALLLAAFGTTNRKANRFTIAPCVALAFLLGAVALAQLTTVPRIAHTPRVISSSRARLVVHLDSALKMRLAFVLNPPNQDELSQFISDVQDSNSPTFHRFLTFDQWKARYAPSDDAVQAAIKWGESNGLTLVHRFGSNLAIVMEGNVATVERAFGVRLNKYELDGKQFYSNDRDPVAPSGPAGIIRDVLGLNSLEHFRSASSPEGDALRAEPVVKPGPFWVERHPVAMDGNGTSSLTDRLRPKDIGPTGPPSLSGIIIGPPDIWSSEAYNYGALYALGHCCNPTHAPGGSPKEYSIAIVGNNKPLQSDYQTFFGGYGLAWLVTEVELGGPSCCNSEMTLDVEWAAAMSNSFGSLFDTAHIFMYEGEGTANEDLLEAWQAALSHDSARVLSTSFGDFEDDFGGLGNPTISDFRDVTNAMVAIGWTLVAAAGDLGAFDDGSHLSVDYPASDPNVIAVGGTTLNLTFDPLHDKLVFGSEVAWNNMYGVGGGGCSNTFFQPSWQGKTLCPFDLSFNAFRRGIPDISLNAGFPQAQYFSFGQSPGWKGVFGTSIGAPELAGFFAQANAYLGSLGNICGRQGNAPCAPIGHPGPALYAAARIAPHNPYYDITTGCNGGSLGLGYCAGPNWDLATGWGSANMLQLAWAINYFVSGPNPHPVVTFGPAPAAGQWYNTDQTVTFNVAVGSAGIAGFTAKWDKDPGDPTSHATPGSGDPFWDGPDIKGLNSGSFGPASGNGLASAGQGCHTAYVRAWDNTGQGAVGYASVVPSYGPLCYDTAPPVVTCGQPDGMWHASDVTIPCTAKDTLSGFANPSDASFGLTTSVPNGTETNSAFTNTHAVCDKAGNCATAGPIGPVEVDKRPPSIVISQPTAGTYLHSDTLTLNYSVTDGGSGVGRVTATMDGSSAVAGHGLSSGQPINLLTDLPLGQHTFTVSATDQVGNTGSLSVIFNIAVTAQSIKLDVNQFVASGAISNSGIANSLLAKLDAAQTARTGGDCPTAANIYNAFDNDVQAQIGKAITAPAATVLVGDSNYLINHCP
jgi:hypothetical protein